MQHKEVLRALSEIMPAIVDGGTPEQVLVKYATDRDLAPAQLERLASMFNSAKTLSVMEKFASDRGRRHRLIDPTSVVRDYVEKRAASARLTPAPKAKAAPAPVFDSPGRISFDVMTGDWAPAQMAKAAGEVAVVDEPSHVAKLWRARDERVKAAHAELSLRILDDISCDAQMDLERNLAQFKQAVRRNPEFNGADFSILEEDFLGLAEGPAIEKQAFVNVVAGQVAALRRDPVTRFSGQSKRAFAIDRTKLASVLVTAWNSFVDVEAAQAVMQEKLAARTLAGNPGAQTGAGAAGAAFPQPGADEAREELRAAVDDMDSLDPVSATPERVQASLNNVLNVAKKHKSVLTESADLDMLARAQAKANQIFGARDAQADASKKQKEKTEKDDAATAQRQTDAANFTLPDRPAGEPDTSAASAIDQLIGSLERGISGAGAWGSGQVGKILTEKNLHALIGKNPMGLAKKKDNALMRDDVRTTLQRLTVSDPVISEADPSLVASLTETVLNAAPSIARDANTLRLVLREGVQYGSIPTHMLSELAKIEQTMQAATRERGMNADRRYGEGREAMVGKI